MESLLQGRHLGKEARELRDRLIRDLLPRLEAGEAAVNHYLKSLSLDELMFLMDFATEELRNTLKVAFEDIAGIPLLARYRPIFLPQYLPEGLCNPLEAYYERVKSRYIRLVKNGHSRNVMYVCIRMRDVIRLAKFLQDQGVMMWGSMTSTHLARFFEENPKMKVNKLNAFIHFIEKKKRFNDGVGRGRRGRGAHRGVNPIS